MTTTPTDVDTVPVSPTSDETEALTKKLASLEKQRSDQQSFYQNQINAQEKVLKAEYGADPSKIHNIQDEGMRNQITKLVFSEYADSKNPYDDARDNGKLISKFDVDQEIKTDKVKSMFAVAKQYESHLVENEDKFFQLYDATNPSLPPEERFNLAMEIAKIRM